MKYENAIILLESVWLKSQLILEFTKPPHSLNPSSKLSSDLIIFLVPFVLVRII